MCTQATEAPTSDMQDPMSLIESVSRRVDALRSDLDSNITSIRDGSVFDGRNFSSVLNGINFFETCETVVESNCTIVPATVPGAHPLPCETRQPEVLLNMVSGINML